MRLALIGVGLFPYMVAGDKNFFLQLIPMLAKGCESIDVISLNDLSGSQQDTVNGCTIRYHNLRRQLHIGNADRYFAGQGSLLDYCHKHKPAQEITEILLTFLMQYPMLRRLVKEREIDVIHFMDNMGPTMRLLKVMFPKVFVSHSAMTYAPRGRCYDRYLRFSVETLDKIIPYSRAFGEKLVQLGISLSKIEVIRWGIPTSRNTLSQRVREQVRWKYGVPLDAKLLVWSGYIQHIREEDFKAAVKVAEDVTRLRSDCRFIFAFKPRSYRKEFKSLESKYIKVETNIENFSNLLGAADLFFSPSLNTDVIVAPPLTWLEAMSMGTPVITTQSGGVQEVVKHLETGFVADSFDRLGDTIIQALDSVLLEQISRNSRTFVNLHCDIEQVADDYLKVWSRKQ